MNTLVSIFHLLMVIHYSYGIYVYLFGLNPPPEIIAVRSSFGGQFKYLTFWDMLLQDGYFIFSLINDFIGTDTRDFKKAKKLQKIRDFMFTTVVFSIGAFVTTSFWVLWHINRDLIFPKIFDSFFPSWLNHNIHTTPLLGVMIEMFLCPHAFPSPRKGFITVALAVVLYMVWVCFVAYKSGAWVYPILQKLPIIGRVAFMAGMAILAYIFYIFGEMLNTKIWGANTKKKYPKKTQ